MSKKEKKMAVLLAVKNKTAITLKELLVILDDNYTERTTRRLLSELVNEGLIVKVGEKRSTFYQASTAVAENHLFNLEAQKAIDYVRLPIFKRNPVAYHPQWLTDYEPNKTFYLSSADRMEMLAQGQRGVEKNSAGTFARKIYNRLLIDLSYNSSRLEGNTYSLLDTEKLIMEGSSVEGKLDAERMMILNHKEAIRHLVDFAPKIKIDITEICTLHFLLSDGLIEIQYSGKFRDHGVRIGASTYVPLENKIELEKYLQIICDKAMQIQDSFEKSLFLLVHVAYLQAFLDVNKRTSRLSANIPLIQNNLVPLSFNDVEKDDYNSAMLAIYELNDVKPLAELYRFSYLRSCQQYDVNLEAMGYDEVRVRYRQVRRDIIRHIILNQLLDHELEKYLQSQSKTIVEKDRERFIMNVHEDLQEISPARINGLGITVEQLNHWLNLKKA